MRAESPLPRVLPEVLPETEFFWRAGASGALKFLRCQDCAYYVHPPRPICPQCLSEAVAPRAVSGRGRIATFTVNYQPWRPDLSPLPYVVALVELEEQPGLRLTTNIINCEIEEIRIEMPVRVVFEEAGDVYLPFFEPDTGDIATGSAA